MEGLRGEIPISELCRREGIAPTMYYRWSKAFLDAGRNGLTREMLRDATTEEVRALKGENTSLKKALGRITDGGTGSVSAEFQVFRTASRFGIGTGTSSCRRSGQR